MMKTAATPKQRTFALALARKAGDPNSGIPSHRFVSQAEASRIIQRLMAKTGTKASVRRASAPTGRRANNRRDSNEDIEADMGWRN